MSRLRDLFKSGVLVWKMPGSPIGPFVPPAVATAPIIWTPPPNTIIAVAKKSEFPIFGKTGVSNAQPMKPASGGMFQCPDGSWTTVYLGCAQAQKPAIPMVR